MSYDLYLIPRSLGPDLVAVVRAKLQDEEDEVDPGPPVAEKEARKQRLARALTTSNPELTVFAVDHAALAAEQDITEDEARRRYRDIELNGAEDGNGIQIFLGDDRVDVTVPYWHHPPDAASVFDEIWGYLHILEREGGLAVYDPQLDRILNLAADRPATLDCYAGVMAQLAAENARAARPAKPWWKFW
jgi:hypothetical protein